MHFVPFQKVQANSEMCIHFALIIIEMSYLLIYIMHKFNLDLTVPEKCAVLANINVYAAEK